MSTTRQNPSGDARQIAEALERCPSPWLRNADLQGRWHCSRASVDRIRKEHGLRSDGPDGTQPDFDLLTILGIERVADPLAAWTLGSDDDREILAAPLLSIDDLQLLDPHRGGYYREIFLQRAREGIRPGFKLGNRWLFRPTIQDLARLQALRAARMKGE